MKATEIFKQTIKSYLDKRAKEDEMFSKKYSNPQKSIDECVNFIFQEVQKSGCCGFSDDEVFGMAVHYYDEAKIKVIEKSRCSVVVNHVVEISELDKAEAKQEAIKKYQELCLYDLKEKAKKKRQKGKAKTFYGF